MCIKIGANKLRSRVEKCNQNILKLQKLHFFATLNMETAKHVSTNCRIWKSAKACKTCSSQKKILKTNYI